MRSWKSCGRKTQLKYVLVLIGAVIDHGPDVLCAPAEAQIKSDINIKNLLASFSPKSVSNWS
jgi:hypothetical protein